MIEANIDAIAGPTHHFGGHSFGNIASIKSKATLSHPKKAALQGLRKMKLLFDLGIPQLVLPPQMRPCFDALRKLGFEGKDLMVIEKAYRTAPELLLQCASSSSMWMANAATITPSCDAADHKVHITCANLASHFHRSLEAAQTQKFFRKIFCDKQKFIQHEMLVSTPEFYDEGAANHTRLVGKNGKGLHFFVYGRSQNKNQIRPKKYPARQTLEAQSAICRLHRLDSGQTLFAQQNPHAIDAGVFHNDVIATGHENLYLVHEEAYVDTEKSLKALQRQAHDALDIVLIKKNMLSLADSVRSYFFNSQIVTSKKKRILIAPTECKKVKAAHELLQSLDCVDEVLFVPLHESMKNGGGPACLRLRLPLTQSEFKSVHQGVVFTDELYKKVKKIIETHYPDELHLEDFLDGSFLKEQQQATLLLYRALELEDLYE